MLPDVMPDTASLAAGFLKRAESDATMVEVLSTTGGPGIRHTYRELIGAARVFAADLRRRGEALGRPVRVG
ncbi:MAG: hypothetical protein WCD21_29795, partial [Streptomyces sp.]